MSSTTDKSSTATFKRYVEVGRIVLLNEGPYANKLAAIVEIIDHNRALIEGPSTGVPRQPFSYRRLTLTPYVIKFPRGAGTTKVKKVFDESDVVGKWEKSAWAQKRKASETRRNLSDFERFQVMLLKKQRRRVVDAAVAKAKKASA